MNRLSSKTNEHIVVLGGGAWGTALASMLSSAGKKTSQWARSSATVDEINQNHKNSVYLNDAKLDENLYATTDIAIVESASVILVVTPAQSFNTLVELLTPHLDALKANATPLILCAKGIDKSSGKFLSQIAIDAFPNQPIAALSGPSFAHDVVKNLPTAVTLACDDKSTANHLAQTLSTSVFRLYVSNDLIGVEVGGALKNIMAIAVGIAHGLNLGKSAEAALIARGFAELQRLALALGAKAETLTGLSGLGDLVLSCSSTQSRNFSYGIAFAQVEDADYGILKNLPLAEGVHSAKMAVKIADAYEIDTPILEAVDAILEGKLSASQAVAALLARPLKHEVNS
jgi:glycerol-3-phosphate dehydrogenase (NAD(P)+)